jgi:putative tricarboxylic transport membrane protein
MIDFTVLASGLNVLFVDPLNLWIVFPGLLIGLFFGAIPGLSVSMAMAIFLPVTFYMDFVPAILFLSAMFTGSCFGSSVPAILINIPGMAASVATTFDGYPMTLKGRHNEALGAALMGSCLGALLGYTILMFAVQPLGMLGLKLGPPEMFMVVLWGLTLIASLSGRHPIRGLMAGTFGVILATIGLSARGTVRGTLGVPELLDGIPVLPAMIGLFAASELFRIMGREHTIAEGTSRAISLRKMLHGMSIPFRRAGGGPMIVYGGTIGTIIGAIPGIGAAVASLVSYSESRRIDREPETFGTGNVRGVIAAESANSSSEGGSMATMLSLGLPGGGATAVMLGAFSMHGLTGGPSFMRQHTDWVYAIIFSNFLQVLLLIPIGLMFIFVAARVVTLPTRVIIPVITVMAFIGSYSLTNSYFGPIIMLIFTVIGWWMRKYDYPVAAAVVGLLLGDMAEGNLLRSYQLGGNDITLILTRPISGTLFASMVLILGFTFWNRRRRARRAAKLG